MSRNSIIISGGLGLVGTLLLTAAAVWAAAGAFVPPFLNRPILVWGLFLFLLILSLLEIPVMIFSMRRIAAGTSPNAKKLVLVTNAAYTLFAGIYAAPFILLAGHSTPTLIAGVGLAGLVIVRFISAVVFLPYEKQS